jgi:hypothetical protein
MEAVRSDVAVVQDECHLRIGGELRESAGFVCGRDGERGNTQVSKVMQGACIDGTGERVGVSGDGVAAVEDQETAGNRL